MRCRVAIAGRRGVGARVGRVFRWIRVEGSRSGRVRGWIRGRCGGRLFRLFVVVRYSVRGFFVGRRFR